MEAILMYWMVAAVYGFICTCWKPAEAMFASEILAARFGVKKEHVFHTFVVIAAVFWPICAPLDVFHVVEHKLMKH